VTPEHPDGARSAPRSGFVRARARHPATPALLAAGLAAAVAVLSLLGFHLRGKAPGPVDPVLLVDEDTCYSGYAPHASDRFDHHPPLVHEAEFDADGFRMSSPAHDPAARCRILCLGDSFTVGLWVKAEEAFPSQLERLLRGRGFSVRVDNGGMQGHTIAEERTDALARWASLHPDLVVVASTGNDLEDLIRLRENGCRLGGAIPTTFRTEHRHAGSGGMQILSARMRAVLNHPDPGDRNAAECTAAWRSYQDLASDLARGVRGLGGRAVLVTLDPFHCGDADGSSEIQRSRQALDERLRGEGALSFDVSSVFREPGTTLAPADGHPSPLGHRRIAEALSEVLVRAGALEACR